MAQLAFGEQHRCAGVAFQQLALLGVVGVFVAVVAAVAAVRLSRPHSYWARRWYADGSARRRRSEQRFPPGRRNRWDRLVDLFADVPHSARTGAVAGSPHTEG